MQDTGDYISREAAEEVFINARKSLNAQKYDYMANEYLTRDTMLLNAEQIIHALPAADVRPVVRAHFNDDWETGCSTCSACGDSFLWEDFNGVGDWHFCPNCGADMRPTSMSGANGEGNHENRTD